jgi:hypothetical protein
MVRANLIGGIALAAIARLTMATTVMMINVWSGIIFFMDGGGNGGDSLSAAAAAGSRHVSGVARGLLCRRSCGS